MLYKLRIALASTILALAAVSATADSASAGASGGGCFQQIVGSEPTSISGLRRAIMMLYGATPVLAGPFGQAGGIAGAPREIRIARIATLARATSHCAN
jgi:hypothetical protein